MSRVFKKNKIKYFYHLHFICRAYLLGCEHLQSYHMVSMAFEWVRLSSNISFTFPSTGGPQEHLHPLTTPSLAVDTQCIHSHLATVYYGNGVSLAHATASEA